MSSAILAAFAVLAIHATQPLGDYSTNEPIMDGTANLTYLMSAQAR